MFIVFRQMSMSRHNTTTVVISGQRPWDHCVSAFDSLLCVPCTWNPGVFMSHIKPYVCCDAL